MKTESAKSRRRPIVLGVGAVLVVALAAAAWWAQGPGRDFLRGVKYPTADYSLGSGEASVLVVGDSYTQGAQASDRDRSYPALLADDLGATVRVSAEVNSGYLAAGLHDHDAADLIDRAPDNAYDQVVIAMGFNDVAGINVLEERVDETIDRARARWPDTQLVVVSPINPGPDLVPMLDETAETISAAACAAGVSFVDGLDWLDRQEYVSDDGVHPNDAGYARIAERLAPVLADPPAPCD